MTPLKEPCKSAPVIEKNRMLWTLVRNEPDPDKARAMIVDFTEEAINAQATNQEVWCAEVVKLNTVLFGNGDPSHSLLARLEDLEELIKTLKGVLYAVLLIVVGELVLKLLGLF